MKAVLEYTYPQDEAKLKHALKGEEYYLALVDLDRLVSSGQISDADIVYRVRRFLDEVLSE
jgi:hypothetical protein